MTIFNLITRYELKNLRWKMSRQGKKRERTFQNIKKFWEAEAEEVGCSPQVTIRDHYFRIHEIQTFLSLIPRCSKLMDIGCGTGFATLALARKADYTLGIDYSEKMVKWANKLKKDSSYRKEISDTFSPLIDISYEDGFKFKINFRVGDLLDLKIKDKDFNVITGQRILINFPSHKDQMKVLRRLREYVVKNGLLLLTEATLQGHQRTDEYRKGFNLPILEKYWHNSYLDENSFGEWKNEGWLIENILGFDTYMLLSKIIYPAACGQENCEFLSGANFAAMEMACLFRTRASVEEIGDEIFFNMYIKRVAKYDSEEAFRIANWISKNFSKLPDWSGLGHQRLLIATPF